MKKVLAVLIAAALLVGLLCVSAAAESQEFIKVLMSTDNNSVEFTPAAQDRKPTMEELNTAVDESDGVIPADIKFVSGRLTLLGTGHIQYDREVYDITLKVWTTHKRPIGLFFCPDEGDTWELVTCNLGDVIEGRFETAGTYAVAVGW